jgi:hypothetical protein
MRSPANMTLMPKKKMNLLGFNYLFVLGVGGGGGNLLKILLQKDSSTLDFTQQAVAAAVIQL